MKRTLEHICRDCWNWREDDTSNKHRPATYREGECLPFQKRCTGSYGCPNWKEKKCS